MIEKGHCKFCGFRVYNQRQFIKAFGLEEYEAPRESIKRTQRGLGLDLYVVIRSWESDVCRRYLQSRWVTEEQALGTYYHPREERIYFPITPLSPEYPPSWVSRSVHNHLKDWRVLPGTDKEHYVYLWNKRILAQDNYPIILVEGVFDVLSPGIHQHGVALLGSTLSDTHSVWLDNHYHTFLWRDPDLAGEHLERKLRTSRLVDKVIVGSPGRDPGSHEPNSPETELVLRWCKEWM